MNLDLTNPLHIGIGIGLGVMGAMVYDKGKNKAGVGHILKIPAMMLDAVLSPIPAMKTGK